MSHARRSTRIEGALAGRLGSSWAALPTRMLARMPTRMPTRMLARMLAALLATATVLLGLLGGLGGLGGLAPAYAHEDDTEATTPEPLAVTLTQLTPATVPERGAITLRGTVQNVSNEVWHDINVAAFMSQSPIVDRDALSDAAVSDPITAPVGSRLEETPGFVGIGDLVPGGTKSFMVRIPQRLLPINGAPGVYWIGAQALGANSEGRDSRADGRARTFIPLVPSDASTRASLIVPVREPIGRVSDGSLLRPGRLAATLAPTGRLGRIAGLLTHTGTVPVAMLVDPAVLAAADDLEDDNPPMNLGPRRTDAPDPDPTDSATPGSTSGGPTPPKIDEADRAGARRFRVAIESEARSHTLLGLPYGDVDAAGLGRRSPSLFAAAAAASDAAFDERKLRSTLTVAPPGGWLDLSALANVTDDLLLLGADHGVVRDRDYVSPTGQPIVITDSQAAEGGALPTDRGAALAMRQRILGDAALEAMSSTDRPLVVSLPSAWDPGRYWALSRFFEGLDQPWLSWEPLETSASGSRIDKLPYPEKFVEGEVGTPLVDAASALVSSSAQLGSLLSSSSNDVARVLSGAAFSAVSYDARQHPQRALKLTRLVDQRTRDKLAAVHVSTQEFVTLSGGSGSVPVSVVNGLDYPVTVGLKATSDDPSVHVTNTEPVRLGAGARTAFRVEVSTDRVGVHDVTLTPVTSSGQAFGGDAVLSLRSSQIGRLLSLLMKFGGAVVVVLFAIRVAARIRTRKESR